MLAHKLVAKIFGMECLELVGDGGAFHKEHAAPCSCKSNGNDKAGYDLAGRFYVGIFPVAGYSKLSDHAPLHQ